jgi:hypothetical protein
MSEYDRDTEAKLDEFFLEVYNQIISAELSGAPPPDPKATRLELENLLRQHPNLGKMVNPERMEKVLRCARNFFEFPSN